MGPPQINPGIIGWWSVCRCGPFKKATPEGKRNRAFPEPAKCMVDDGRAPHMTWQAPSAWGWMRCGRGRRGGASRGKRRLGCLLHLGLTEYSNFQLVLNLYGIDGTWKYRTRSTRSVGSAYGCESVIVPSRGAASHVPRRVESDDGEMNTPRSTPESRTRRCGEHVQSAGACWHRWIL